ncbi:MAG: HesA/MoeB/ThiF family protein [Flavobacteriaceae bacterium]
MKPTKKEFFKRQITLSEIGENGQQKLQNASVLVVGCGGLGSPIAVHLASSGVGKIHLVDFDTVDVTNLHRQVYYSLDDVGKSKAKTLSEFIKKRAPYTDVSFSNFSITKENVFDLISNYDIIVDGTDSLPTKYLLNDACVLKDKPLVYGSLYKFDGYVSIFNVLQKDGTRSSNLRDAFPTMATDIPNCEEAGTLNAIVATIASLQVNEVLKLITGIGKPITNQLLIYNVLQNSQLKMKLTSKVTKKEIQQIFDTESYFDASCELRNPDWLITSKELKQQINNVKIISVIANTETTYPFKIDKNIPLSKLENSNFKPLENKTYVLICMKGNSSYTATKILKAKFPKTNFLSLEGGISTF